MRKYILFATIITAMVLTSCKREVLNMDPETQKSLINFYNNATQIEEGVSAAYGNLQLAGQYGVNFMVFGELPSDNTYDEVPANDGGFYGQLDLFQMTSLNSLITATWRDAYVGIQQCNIILNRIDNIEIDSTLKKHQKGEMLFIRALTYFNLVRIFGDVPLTIEETTNPNTYFGQGRTVKTQVYEQIIKDLNDATTLLPLPSEAKQGHANQCAANALLGKVFLTLHQYDNALKTLSKCLNQGYALVDVNTLFDPNQKNNKELIFSVQFQSGLNGNSEGSNAFQLFMPSGFVNGAKGHNLPTKEIYQLYSSNDTRRDAYIGLTNSGTPYTKKLRQTSSVIQDGGSNIVVLRYADVLLMLAECYTETNHLVNARLYLNQIRQRAGLSAYTETTKNSITEEIALQRRLEFIGEGHRWFDLIRTGKAVEVMNTYFKRAPGYQGIMIDTYQLLQPIPQGQINTDKSITQNPGY